ncbi:MAG TPA: endonuclease/exonuclease/phosphatase family protein [Candidatus Hydrogenedentes bacterium]|nr:endonuclease/exonuclease/phosphatase family protein [Candidatus Hydrogenedentota bacterium]
MKKVLIGCGVVALIPVCLVAGLFIFMIIMAPGNSRVEAPTDFSKSALRANPPAPLPRPVTLKIVTFNIQDTWVVGFNRPERMRRIAKVLTQLDPDIAGFQEAFIDEDRKILTDGLINSRLLFHQYFKSATGGSGLLLMSAFPIKEAYFHRYTVSNAWYKFWEGDWWAGKGVGLVRIELPGGGGYIDFYDTHLQANYGIARYRHIRGAQLLEMADFIDETRTGASPAFLVGDMNTRMDTEEMNAALEKAKLRRVMNLDSRIDHIYAVEDPRYAFEVLDTMIIPEKWKEGGKSLTLSDHNGYMTTVRVTPVQGK